MPHRDPEIKKARARAAYKLRRDQKLIAAGIDPALLPMRDDGKRTAAITKRRDSSLPEFLVLEMLPQPGETEEENRRRKNRIKANFYNSRMTPEQRAEKNARVRAAYEKDAQNLQARRKEIYNLDPERHRDYGRKYFLKNKESRLATLVAWGKNNPDRLRAARDRWAIANKNLLSQYSSAYRAKLADAAPIWTDWDAIYWLYEEAAKRTAITDVKHVVDHILPINGKDVSG